MDFHNLSTPRGTTLSIMEPATTQALSLAPAGCFKGAPFPFILICICDTSPHKSSSPSGEGDTGTLFTVANVFTFFSQSEQRHCPCLYFHALALPNIAFPISTYRGN